MSRKSSTGLNKDYLQKTTGPAGYSQPYGQAPRYGSGLVSLGGTKKARLPASTSASKLAVPRPVNLPSLRKENAGNDPNTQIVPSGSGSSWQRVEESAPAPADPKTALTAGSTWASTQSKDSGWQPPAPAVSSLPPPRPGPRRLNPHEYPSLSAAASGRQQSLPKQRVPSVPDTQGVANWDEDERRLPSVQSSLVDGPDRSEEVYRPPWDDRGDAAGVRGALDDGYGGPIGRGPDEDRWGSASTARRPPFFRASSGPDRFGSQDRFGGDFPPFAEDPTLFPPPPSARPTQPPPPPPPPRTDGPSDRGSGALVDPEREAFLAQLDSLAQDLEKDRLKKLEAKEGPPAAEEEPVKAPSPPPEPERLVHSTSEPLTLAQVAAAHAEEASDSAPLPAAAQLNAKLARRHRELEEEEAERKRKEAAAAKLKALDEAIAAREAERRALEELAAKAAAEEAAEAEALAAKKAAEEAAAQEAAAEAEAEEQGRRIKAAEEASRAMGTISVAIDEETGDATVTAAPKGPSAEPNQAQATPRQPQRVLGFDPEVEGSLHGSSVDVQVDSSVAQDAFSDEERSAGADTKDTSDAPAIPVPPPNAWKKPPMANGPAETWPEQPIALPTAPASKRKGELAAKESGPKAQQAQQQRKELQKADPLHKDKQPAAEPKELGTSATASDSLEGAPSQLPPAPVAPKTPALSWRKILAGDDPVQRPEVPEAQPQQQAQATTKAESNRARGRGRGREGRGRPERDNGELSLTSQDGDNRGRGRGRGRGERQARGRGDRKAAAVAAAPAADPVSPIADNGTSAPSEGHAAEQPRRGRRSAETRARGGRDTQTTRGRARAAKAVSGRAGAAGILAVPSPTVVPAEASVAPENAAVTAVASMDTKTTSADPIIVLKPPTAAPSAVLPSEPTDSSITKGTLDPPAMPPGLGWDAIAPEPPGLGWGRPAAVSSAIDSGAAADTFLPASKPIVASGGPDPPVERPKSAAGVVSRPRSSGGSTLGLPGDLLPNGMPALPADLQLDAPITLPKEGPKFSAAQASAEGSGFQGGLFAMPSQPSNSMWQQFGQVNGQQPSQQQRTSAGLPQAHREQDNSDFSLGRKGAWGAPAVTGISPTSQSQLGAFSSGPSNISAGPPGLQFGQVMSGGFGAFVPTGKQPDWSANTGKQPDWSTGAVGTQPDWSTGPLTSSKAPASYPASVGLAVVGSSSFTAPQGPGTQLRTLGPMQLNGDPTMNGMPHPATAQGGGAARSADPTANLPDDVFGPDELRPMEPKFTNSRAAGPSSAVHTMRGGPDAGGRRGGRTIAARGGPAGRGYARGRSRDAAADTANGGPDGPSRRSREGPHGTGRGQQPRPANGPPNQEGPVGFDGQPGGGRGGYKVMGRERGRGGRAGGRDRMAQWVPLPNTQTQSL